MHFDDLHNDNDDDFDADDAVTAVDDDNNDLYYTYWKVEIVHAHYAHLLTRCLDSVLCYSSNFPCIAEVFAWRICGHPHVSVFASVYCDVV